MATHSIILAREAWWAIVHGVTKSETQLKQLSGGDDGLVSKLCPTLETPWIVVGQAPLSMGFSRPEYWSGLP